MSTSVTPSMSSTMMTTPTVTPSSTMLTLATSSPVTMPTSSITPSPTSATTASTMVTTTTTTTMVSTTPAPAVVTIQGGLKITAGAEWNANLTNTMSQEYLTLRQNLTGKVGWFDLLASYQSTQSFINPKREDFLKTFWGKQKIFGWFDL